MNITIHHNIIITPRGNKNAFNGSIRPLRQIYREKEKGLPVSLFSEVTGLDMNELYRKLLPLKFLNLVTLHGRVYILKDIYWDSLLAYLERGGKDIIEPTYVTLKKCKTA